MNRKMIVWIITILFSIAIGVITYRIVRKPRDNISLNETTKNVVQISEIDESKEDEVTVECLNERNDYVEYISESEALQVGYSTNDEELIGKLTDVLEETIIGKETYCQYCCTKE